MSGDEVGKEIVNPPLQFQLRPYEAHELLLELEFGMCLAGEIAGHSRTRCKRLYEKIARQCGVQIQWDGGR